MDAFPILVSSQESQYNFLEKKRKVNKLQLLCVISFRSSGIMKQPIWGIDLGGTKIEGVVLKDQYSLNVLARKRIATEAHQGYSHILSRIKKLVDLLKKETQSTPEAIGIGTPGSIDYQTSTMKNSNTTCLNGRSLKMDLERELNIPIFMANDANCFAVAETNLGTVKDLLPAAKVVFGVIMGTGVGGGIVFNGKVWNGKNGIGGEWGHNFLDESGGACYCGKSGCVETVISGPALEKFYYQQSGEKKRMPEILLQHQQGVDKAATQTIERMINGFGKAISAVINILDPDAVVIGGGLGNIDLLYSEGVNAVKKNIFNPYLRTSFLRPKLGDSAGVFGAALLVP